ncbi:MAG: HAD-IA family hydrolase [Oscillospiraceae bacterium]|jgi:putative hydrolase of the HAD superfamily|nr:HAD-IA family hydrolase [Oscillospiraceae bacterium]
MKILLLDMYGVIIEESKGNFTPFVYARFPFTDKADYRAQFTKAQLGEISGDAFMRSLGFTDTQGAVREYIENHLTLDPTFHAFAKRFSEEYDFALLSNDVSEKSEYIREYHDIKRYFKAAIVSANVGCRKPDAKIYEIALERLGVAARDCIFVDNSVANLIAAASVGMDTVLFNRDGEDYDGKVVYSFEELGKILTI